MKQNAHITLAKVGAPHGIAGWLSITRYKNALGDVSAYPIWFLCNLHQHYTKVHVEAIRPYKKGYIAKLRDIDSREAAVQLTHHLVTITRSQLAPLPPDEYYWNDFIGLAVIDQHGKHLGKVAYLIATGSNDVLMLDGKMPLAIPYLPNDVIKHVDLHHGTIHVDWECLLP